MKKGQSTIEFLLLLTILVIGFIIASNTIKEHMQTTMNTVGNIVNDDLSNIDTGLNSFYGKYAPLGDSDKYPDFELYYPPK